MSFLGTVPPSALPCPARPPLSGLTIRGHVLWDPGFLELAVVTITRDTLSTVLREGAALAQILVPEASTRGAGVGYSQVGQPKFSVTSQQPYLVPLRGK